MPAYAHADADGADPVRDTRALTKEFEDLRNVVAEQIGHIQKAEAGRRSGEFGEAGVCGGLPVGAGGVREAKYGESC